MKIEKRIPTLAGLLLLVLGVAAGVILVERGQIFKLRASPEITPKEIRITNITDAGFSVSWTTEKETIGFVTFGTTSGLGQTANDDQDKRGSPAPHFIHHVSLTNLSPNTRYFFKIGAGGKTFDNDGQPWEQTTGPALSPRAADIISGSVQDNTGLGVAGAVIYITLPAASPLSATTDGNGRFSLSLSAARTSDLSSFASYDKQGSTLSVFVRGANGQVSSAQVTTGNARPMPPLILGQTHDFRKAAPGGDTTSPASRLELPTPTPAGSPEAQPTFNLEPLVSPQPQTQKLTIKNPTEGEKIATTKPEFLGTGSPGSTITLTLESSVYTDKVKVGTDGTWKWTPKTALSAGTHKITISVNQQSITRNFTVLAAAAGLPAITSTPSAETTPTPVSTSPGRVSLPSTQSGVPVSGNLTTTFLLFILGIVSIFGGILLFKVNPKL